MSRRGSARHGYTAMNAASVDSQGASQPSRKAPPVGRALRIVIGLLLMIQVVPVYFHVDARLALGALLLMLGHWSSTAYFTSLSRDASSCSAPGSGPSWDWQYSSPYTLLGAPERRSLGAEKGSSQRAPSSVPR